MYMTVVWASMTFSDLMRQFQYLRHPSSVSQARALLWSQASNKSFPIEWNHDLGIDQKLDTQKQPRA